ncbi:MAG: DUF721 domain-containing protein [Gammaproteobacteria bacterium]|nr:DUF721 domain-containing protein [Gammaproteobacteria bacterium]
MSGQKNLNTRNLIARQFNELVDSSEQLNNLYTHAKGIYALNEKLQKHLDPSLSSHCTVANYSDETLTVNAETSAWASKLRYCVPDILNYAKHECGLTKLKSVRIKVSPIQNKTSQSDFSNTHSVRKASLSKKSADFIKSVATSIKDPALRKSILKISKHSR